MLKTVFLDLDDTILDFTRAEAAALRRALTEADVPADDGVLARYHAINAAQWELLEEGVLTREQVLLGRFDILFGELGLVRSAGEICERYEEYLGEGHWFIPGAEALLETLAPRYDLYLASNGAPEVQHRRMESAGISRYHEGWRRAMRRRFNAQNYYLTEKGLTFFFPMYAIAPPVEGIPVFTLPYGTAQLRLPGLLPADREGENS